MAGWLPPWASLSIRLSVLQPALPYPPVCWEAGGRTQMTGFKVRVLAS